MHLGDLRERDAQAAAAKAEHGVGLVQLLNPRQQRTKLVQLGRLGIGVFEVLNFHQQIFPRRQELMQRRIEQADSYRQRFHALEQAGEVGALHGQ